MSYISLSVPLTYTVLSIISERFFQEGGMGTSCHSWLLVETVTLLPFSNGCVQEGRQLGAPWLV